MRTIGEVSCYILADDVLIITKGQRMIGKLAEALNKTNEFIGAMGAKVAVDKSFNFSATEAGKE